MGMVGIARPEMLPGEANLDDILLSRFDELSARVSSLDLIPALRGLLRRSDLVVREMDNHFDLRRTPAPITCRHPADPVELGDTPDSTGDHREAEGDCLEDSRLAGAD